MKNIFIVTDFSPASQNAGRYGIEIARRFKANVFLFHAYQPPVNVPESYLVYTAEDVWATVKELLEKETAVIDPTATVPVEICGGEGTPANAIITEAIKRDADVIICGMKNGAKTFRKIFGSTATALSAKSHIPLIVVPDNAIFREPKTIALASDMDAETSAATVELLKEIGERFHSRLSIVWVVENEVDPGHELRFHPLTLMNELKDLNPVFEFPKGSNIIKTLEGFVKDHGMDMMAMIPHKHDWLERFFTETITKNMLFHTDIPLLILPQKKNTEMNDLVKNDMKAVQDHG